MLASYMDHAREIAVYEKIEEEGSYWGEIPGLQGVWARHGTLESCRRELREALSDWIAVRQVCRRRKQDIRVHVPRIDCFKIA